MARGRDPNLIAQQLLQGQAAQVAPTTGFVPQPQLQPQQLTQAQALLGPAQALIQQPITSAAELLQGPNVGRGLIAKNLLEFSSDRSRNPLARGLAAFIGSKTLQEQGELEAEQGRRATRAAAEQQQFERGVAERELALKEATGRAQRGKFEAEAAKLERETLRGGDPKDIRESETKVRKEFTNLSKDFFKQRDAFGRIQASAQDPSAAGDLALIFNFMKVLDPGSTVREGEFATAESSGSIPDRITARYNKILQGERLAPDQRADFVKRGESLFNSANAQHDVRIDAFAGLASRTGLNPKNVTIDLGLAEQEATKEVVDESIQEAIPTGQSVLDQQTVATQAQFDALPSGAVFIENGQTFRKP